MNTFLVTKWRIDRVRLMGLTHTRVIYKKITKSVSVNS